MKRLVLIVVMAGMFSLLAIGLCLVIGWLYSRGVWVVVCLVGPPVFIWGCKEAAKDIHKICPDRRA